MRTIVRAPVPSGAARAAAMAAEFGDLSASDLVRALRERHGERLVALSSFGADAAVLLRLIALADPDMRVIFLDTGAHFGETLRHRDTLIATLGLSNVVSVRPQPLEVIAQDPAGRLRLRDADACCALRKVRPLERALDGVDVLLTGRRGHQSADRQGLPIFQADGPRVRVNPLARWSEDDVDAYAFAFGLPVHPLVADGYRSIGCEPCTTPTLAGEDARAGRWRGQTKTECGIHGLN